MKLLYIILSLVLLLSMVSSARIDSNRRVQSMYKISESPPRKGGVKGGHTTTQRPLKKGEYICGNKICKLRPDEVPKWCEGGECQYNIGYHPHN